MKKIKVYGELKKFLGQGTFYFDVSTPSQALKALFVNFKGLEKWILDNDKNGVVYKVKVGTEEIGEENMTKLTEVFVNEYVSKNPDLKLSDLNKFVIETMRKGMNNGKR